MPEDIWLYIALLLGVVVVALVILLVIQREKRKPLVAEPQKPSRPEVAEVWPLAAGRSVNNNVVKEAKDRLRILDLEREILSYAIRRLYEARAEGKLTEEERDSLAVKYKDDLTRIKEEISRGESIIALNELERMQEEFVQLFSERFEALNKRIEDLRTVSGFTPPKSEPTEPEKVEEEKIEQKTEVFTSQDEKAPPIRRKKEVSRPRASSDLGRTEKLDEGKTEAEKKAEQILAEVEKVLERLGQMEVEE